MHHTHLIFSIFCQEKQIIPIQNFGLSDFSEALLESFIFLCRTSLHAVCRSLLSNASPMTWLGPERLSTPELSWCLGVQVPGRMVFPHSSRVSGPVAWPQWCPDSCQSADKGPVSTATRLALFFLKIILLFLLLFIYIFLAMLHSMWDLSSLTGDWPPSLPPVPLPVLKARSLNH